MVWIYKCINIDYFGPVGEEGLMMSPWVICIIAHRIDEMRSQEETTGVQLREATDRKDKFVKKRSEAQDELNKKNVGIGTMRADVRRRMNYMPPHSHIYVEIFSFAQIVFKL